MMLNERYLDHLDNKEWKWKRKLDLFLSFYFILFCFVLFFLKKRQNKNKIIIPFAIPSIFENPLVEFVPFDSNGNCE